MPRSIRSRYVDQYRLQKRKHLQKKVLLAFGIIVCGAVGLVYGLFFSGILQIRDIQVASESSVQSEVNTWLDTKQFFIPRRNNILFFSTNALREHLLGLHPEFETLKIDKDFNHTLRIGFTERVSAGIWCDSRQSCFYIDTKGLAYASAPETSGYLVLHVDDKREKAIKIGDVVASEQWLGAIVVARGALADVGIRVNQFIIPANSFEEFDAVTERGWPVLLSLQTDIPRQVKAMTLYMKQKLSPQQVTALQYMDLRVNGRLYFK